MSSLALAISALCLAQPPACSDGEIAGWLWPGCPSAGCCQVVPYVPHEGDVVLMTDVNLFLTLTYRTASGYWHPRHSGLVVRRCDGSLSLLESGGQRPYVTLFPVGYRFAEHMTDTRNGVIWVRQIRRPLTPEESARLTCFAEAQIGKRFPRQIALAVLAFPRLAARLIDPSHPTWYCSAIVAEGLVAAGLLPREAVGPVVFPSDMYHDLGPSLACGWGPPIRASVCPDRPPTGGPRRAPR
jgi:hypothetical protein